MNTMNKEQPFSIWWEMLVIVSVLVGIILVGLSMTDFGRTREFHLFVGIVATLFAVLNMFKISSVFAPAGILVWSVLAAICFSGYAGVISVFR